MEVVANLFNNAIFGAYYCDPTWNFGPSILKVNNKQTQIHANIFLKMPFKQGFAPIRRTVQYLNQSPIVFIDKVKVMTINYNVPQQFFTKKTEFPQHEGMNVSR